MLLANHFGAAAPDPDDRVGTVKAYRQLIGFLVDYEEFCGLPRAAAAKAVLWAGESVVTTGPRQLLGAWIALE